MFRVALLATAASAIHILAPSGDPQCKFGHRSTFATQDVNVCCPSYCGVCNDFEECKAKNNQDSENACCASSVQKLTCENNAEDPYCLKSCDVKSAPCSLGTGEPWVAPGETSAAADCGNAVGEFKKACETTVKGVPEATGQWDALENRATAESNAENAKFAKNNDFDESRNRKRD